MRAKPQEIRIVFEGINQSAVSRSAPMLAKLNPPPRKAQF